MKWTDVPRSRSLTRSALMAGTGFGLAAPLCGCIVAGGYSSRGGWFLWPGGLGMLFIVLLILFVLRRR